MKNLTCLLSVALLVVSSHGYAKMTFFSCDLDAGSNGPARHFEYTYDDQARTVSYDLPSVGIRRHDPAQETPDSLVFTAGVIAHSINRVNLSITETYQFSDDKTLGRCLIVKPAAGAQF
jgi:hypothetical protein